MKSKSNSPGHQTLQQSRFEVTSLGKFRDSSTPPHPLSLLRGSLAKLRGIYGEHQHRYCKFIEEAWKHPKTLEIISRIAGVDLVPVVDYEIGHINISVPKAIKKNKQGDIVPEDDEKAVVDWHRDSYPFVCVLMMSDTTGMIGGETALKTGRGDIMKVRGPTMVRLPQNFHHLLSHFANISRDVALSCKGDTLNTKLSLLSVLKSVSPW
jgi:hypothetical protein